MKQQYPCSNCKLLLPTGCFSKKKCRQRNPKNLLCLACLGRCSSSSMMLTYSNNNNNSNNNSNNSSNKTSATKKKAIIKRECFECGKFLPRDRFSKTQWIKNKTPCSSSSSSSSSSSNGSGTADCKSCVVKKQQQQATDKSICQHCRRPKASPGFHICRECHLLEKDKQNTSKPVLPDGVRYNALDVRDDNFQGQALSFETPPPHHNPLDWTTTLIGTYQLIYLSIDENWSPKPILSSTVQGSIEIELFEDAAITTTTTTEEENQQQKSGGIKGSIHLKHLPFQERLRAINTFHSVDISSEQHQGRQQGRRRRQQQVQNQNQSSFYASHVHHFAPETTWHDPRGDVYTHHGASNCGGKLKVLADDIALFLEKPQSQHHQHQRQQQQSRRRRNNANNRTTPASGSTSSILIEHAHDRYTDVTMYWCCRHLRLPEDVGRVIREYVCPPPVLPLLAGDIVLVASMMGEDEVDWSEVTLVGRKII